VVKLECHTSQSTTTKWYFENRELHRDTNTTKYELQNEGKRHILIVKKVEKEEIGTYKCTVRDQVTQATITMKGNGRRTSMQPAQHTRAASCLKQLKLQESK
jgi:Immunoglobulin I-set domain